MNWLAAIADSPSGAKMKLRNNVQASTSATTWRPDPAPILMSIAASPARKTQSRMAVRGGCMRQPDQPRQHRRRVHQPYPEPLPPISPALGEFPAAVVLAHQRVDDQQRAEAEADDAERKHPRISRRCRRFGAEPR